MKTVSELLLQLWGSAGAPGRVLVVGGEAALPLELALEPANASVTWIATDVREHACVTAGDRVDARSDPANPLVAGERFDAVLLPVPPDRALARRWLRLAWEALAPDGRVVLAGANAEGIRSVIADAAKLFGPALREEFRQKHRVATLVRGSEPETFPDWFDSPGIAPGSWQSVAVDSGEGTLSLATLPGVFAGVRLDPGTALLLRALPGLVSTGSRVLDVGCGAGAIGFSALRLGAGAVDMADVNLLAVASVRRTIAEHGLTHARVLAGDVYDAVPEERYDLILSNPPFHQGKAIDFAMPERLIGEAARHLRPEGALLIVANTFLTYGRQLERHFRDVRAVAATRQYQVLHAASPILARD